MKPYVGSVAAAGLVLALVSAAGAQGPPSPEPQPGTDLGVRAPAPPPKPELGLEPTRPPEETGAREQEFRPAVPLRSKHDPAFVTPFVADVPVSPTTKARVGLSGWTAPAVPYDSKDGAGGVAFGLTIVWDLPAAPAPGPEPESPPTGQR
jgi:hypothetical protein